MSVKSKIINVLFWSIVSAAFIGPGTITTATKAGANFQFDLLWALLFSTFACLLLQEASARITITSGMNLGQAIAKQFEGKSTKNLVLILIIGAIVLGSAAYETGNVLGAVAGLSLVFTDTPQYLFVLLIAVLAIIALSLPSFRVLAKIMGAIVILMGVSFFTTAILLEPDLTEIFKGCFMPTIPNYSIILEETSGAGLLVLALIGTTVVPYDIFLGSGVLDKKQRISEMRFGLSIAVILGGVISMAVLIVGTTVTTEVMQKVSGEQEITENIVQDYLYPALRYALTDKIGSMAVYVLGFGMFAAGFSSAITAPLASAITARSLFEKKGNDDHTWEPKGIKFKFVWGIVLATGLIFGLFGIKPVPAIILAQALNGLILPFISIFLIFVVNDPKLMGDKNLNGWGINILMGIVVWVTLILGLTNVVKAADKAWDLAIQQGNLTFVSISIITLIMTSWILAKIYLVRNRKKTFDF